MQMQAEEMLRAMSKTDGVVPQRYDASRTMRILGDAMSSCFEADGVVLLRPELRDARLKVLDAV